MRIVCNTPQRLVLADRPFGAAGVIALLVGGLAASAWRHFIEPSMLGMASGAVGAAVVAFVLVVREVGLGEYHFDAGTGELAWRTVRQGAGQTSRIPLKDIVNVVRDESPLGGTFRVELVTRTGTIPLSSSYSSELLENHDRQVATILQWLQARGYEVPAPSSPNHAGQG